MRTTQTTIQLAHDAHPADLVPLADLTDTANRGLMAVGPFLVGLAAVGLLITAVFLGIRNLRNRPDPPTADEQPHLPDSGPVVEVQEHPHDAEMPHDGRRRFPHEIRPDGVTTEDDIPEGEDDAPEDDGQERQERQEEDEENQGGAQGRSGQGKARGRSQRKARGQRARGQGQGKSRERGRHRAEGRRSGSSKQHNG